MEFTGQFAQLIVSGITSGCIYAIVAVGFSIIYNSTQVINFAQGEFVMAGAMIAAVLMDKTGPAIALPLAVAGGCALGVVTAMFVLAPLRKASAVTLIIITVGASIMYRGLAQLFWGETAIAVRPFTPVIEDGYVEDRTVRMFGAVVSGQELWVVGVTAVLVLASYLFFRYSLVGQAMRASASNPMGARMCGISVRKMILVSFVIAAGLGAAAGVTVSPVFYAKCNMGTALGLKGFCAAVLGGLGNFGGAIAAGIILGVVESVAGGMLWSDYKDAVAFVILLVILFVRPEGLLMRRKRAA